MIVITADDLGLSPGVTRGILESHTGGVVRSTSLLVTYPESEEAAALARQTPTLEVGLHLDLVGGEPAAGAAAVPSLVGPDGRFHALGELTRRLLTGRVRPREVATEIRAQVARARSWGITPLAWDSHRHVHLMPPIARVVGAVARESGVRWVRRARPRGIPGGAKPSALAVATAMSGVFLRRLDGNDWYVDLTSLEQRPHPLALAAARRRSGMGEIGAHPGHADAALGARDTLVEERALDLALLTDPVLRDALADSVRWRVIA